MLVSRGIINVLKEEGVHTVFGVPGGANLPLYDALFDGGIRHILTRHEQGAGHAAEGYAKASGNVGVSIATSGPGATNLVTSIADAYMDSVPTVFITGQVRRDLIGTDGFQEADIYGITMPIVKHSYSLRDSKDVIPALREAFYLAQSGRPGPVLVDIPNDLFKEDIILSQREINLPGYSPSLEGNKKQINLAIEALKKSQKPVIYAGGGVIHSKAANGLRRFVDITDIPVTSTVMALGAYPASGPQWLGMLGMHGTRAANYAIDEADLVICIGARFDDRVTGKLSEFSPSSCIIHIDIDPAEINKNVAAHIPIVGDCGSILQSLCDQIEHTFNKNQLSNWHEQIHNWQDKYPLPSGERADGLISPHSLIDGLAYVAPKAIISSDVGQHQMWCAQRFPFNQPHQWLNSGGLGTMGFGLPAAIGAKVACPDEEVICLAGDGSLAMSATEIATAVEAQIPVKICVMNNGGYGMVRQWQELFWDERYSQVQMGHSTNWKLVAEGFGANARSVSRPDELISSLEWLLEQEGVALLDVVVGEDSVYPMIPSGAAAREMIG